MTTNILPLGIKNRTKTELPALIALEAIGQDWFSESHRFDLMSIALVSQLLTIRGSEIHLASSALVSMLESPTLDAKEIRPPTIMINTWLQKQPNCRVQAAITKLLNGAKAAPNHLPKRKFG
jgi:hypothetical protein